MKKPVYSLVKGDVFIGDDQRIWTVDEVIKPDDWNILGEIGAKPKNWEILAHTGTTYRQFFYPGIKLFVINEAS